MPLYDYRCGSCSHTFELKQRFTDEPIAACPHCGRDARRLVSPVGIIFKGSGWYVNDHGRKGVPSPNGNGDRQESSPPAKDASASKEAGKETSATSSAATEE